MFSFQPASVMGAMSPAPGGFRSMPGSGPTVSFQPAPLMGMGAFSDGLGGMGMGLGMGFQPPHQAPPLVPQLAAACPGLRLPSMNQMALPVLGQLMQPQLSSAMLGAMPGAPVSQAPTSYVPAHTLQPYAAASQVSYATAPQQISHLPVQQPISQQISYLPAQEVSYTPPQQQISYLPAAPAVEFSTTQTLSAANPGTAYATEGQSVTYISEPIQPSPVTLPAAPMAVGAAVVPTMTSALGAAPAVTGRPPPPPTGGEGCRPLPLTAPRPPPPRWSTRSIRLRLTWAASRAPPCRQSTRRTEPEDCTIIPRRRRRFMGPTDLRGRSPRNAY